MWGIQFAFKSLKFHTNIFFVKIINLAASEIFQSDLQYDIKRDSRIGVIEKHVAKQNLYKTASLNSGPQS